MMKVYRMAVGLLACAVLNACEKEPGEGGNSVIVGKVIERSYVVFPNLYSDKPAMDRDVFIIYGDGSNAIDDRTRTSFDGSFKFEFLKRGDYRVFVYGEDTALTNFGNDKALIFEASIKKNNSEVRIPDITISNL